MSWYSGFYFLDHKDFFKPIWSSALWEDIFAFLIFSHDHQLWIYDIHVIMLNTILNTYTWRNISIVYFYCLMICLVVFINCFISFINVSIFWYRSDMLVNFVFQSFDKSLQQQTFHCCLLKYISLSSSGGH